MKNHRKRNLHSLQHLQDIENIGLKTECPLIATTYKKSNTGQATEFITWLKLQNYKMSYRLLYCDIAVCCTYIVFLFTTLRFHTQMLPNRWFYGFTMLVLVFCCVLFIGIHMLPHKMQTDKKSFKTLSANWETYTAYFQRWPKVMGLYLLLLAISVVMYFYNESQPAAVLISFLLLFTTLLYAYGIKIIIECIRAKEYTNRYKVEASRLKV